MSAWINHHSEKAARRDSAKAKVLVTSLNDLPTLLACRYDIFDDRYVVEATPLGNDVKVENKSGSWRSSSRLVSSRLEMLYLQT